MWILVEGESEVWILSELAKLLEINLEMEGIRIVEFAQSGLKPLLKYVQAMGIQWYVLTDGDEAGKNTVKSSKICLMKKWSGQIELPFYPNVILNTFFMLMALRMSSFASHSGKLNPIPIL